MGIIFDRIIVYLVLYASFSSISCMSTEDQLLCKKYGEEAPCESLHEGSIECPAGCANWLQEMPSTCKELVERGCLRTDQSHMDDVNSLCGSGFQCKRLATSSGPSLPAVPSIPGIPGISGIPGMPSVPGMPGTDDIVYPSMPGMPTIPLPAAPDSDGDEGAETPPVGDQGDGDLEDGEGEDDAGDVPYECVEFMGSPATTKNMQRCLQDAAAYAQSQVQRCPLFCELLIEGIPEGCEDYMADVNPKWDSPDLDICFGVPPSPEPSPESPPNPDPLPVPRPEYDSSFSCDEGDGYQWIELDPDAASQWGEADAWEASTGASNAITTDCSNMFQPSINGSDLCCAETAADPFPWWQYDMGESMTIKGVRITPPSPDSLCCEDEECSEVDRCSFLHLFDSMVTVGDFSLPDFYLTTEYKELLQSLGGDASMAQPEVAARLEDGSALCNTISEFQFLTAEGTLTETADIGCGLGPMNEDSGMPTPKGRFVSVHMPTGEPTSLALCGIEVCAKKNR